MELFEQASRLKLRFETPKGQVTVEDLWDLPLTSGTGRANLDDIAKSLHRILKNTADDVSFVTPAIKRDTTFQVAFEVVKHVIGVRVAESDVAAEKILRAEKKQRLLELIASKQDQELAGKSLDELQAMVQSL